MRIPKVLALLVTAFAAWTFPATAQEAFDACNVFTAEDAEKALGTKADPEPVNPKAKRPRTVLGCSYHGARTGSPSAPPRSSSDPTAAGRGRFL